MANSKLAGAFLILLVGLGVQQQPVGDSTHNSKGKIFPDNGIEDVENNSHILLTQLSYLQKNAAIENKSPVISSPVFPEADYEKLSQVLLEQEELRRDVMIQRVSEQARIKKASLENLAFRRPREKQPLQLVDLPGGKAILGNFLDQRFSASASRCSVASINANWFDIETGEAINLSVIDSEVIVGIDTGERGVFGVREVFNQDAPRIIRDKATGTIMRHLIARHVNRGTLVHENNNYDSQPIKWEWAVSGLSLITGGEVSAHLDTIDESDYTHGTQSHSFIGSKKDGSILLGATNSMNAWEITQWLKANGYTDGLMLDGGGSTELNIFEEPIVGGTDRNISNWVGIGCAEQRQSLSQGR